MQRIEGAQARLDDRQFTVTVDVPHDLRATGDRVAVSQVFANLVDNAIKYSTTDRRLDVRGHRRGSSVTVEFADHGSGIPADEVRMGMRVKAVWKPREEWTFSLENIDHFEPADEPDADYDTYRHHL